MPGIRHMRRQMVQARGAVKCYHIIFVASSARRQNEVCVRVSRARRRPRVVQSVVGECSRQNVRVRHVASSGEMPAAIRRRACQTTRTSAARARVNYAMNRVLFHVANGEQATACYRVAAAAVCMALKVWRGAR